MSFFLDVEIKIVGESVETSVFRKKTHTGVVLNFSAIVPNCWKEGVIRNFSTGLGEFVPQRLYSTERLMH